MLDLRHARPALWIVAALCVALPVSATSAAASVTIGRLAPTPSVSCTGSTFDFIEPTVTSGTGYVVPSLPPASGLVVTSWSHNAAPAVGALTMKVFRKVADPARYMVVGHDGPRDLVPATLNTFQARVPVQPGDVIGINSAIPASTACTFNDPGETHLARPGNLADGESEAFLPGASDRSTNVSAAVEEDADGDGFGDETQDECPTDAAKQEECDPPETTITKGAPSKLDKPKVKFKFTSDEPGSTFECKLDKKPFKPCESPKKVKRLDEGRHKFKVVATDEAGNTDPTAAKDKFKVVSAAGKRHT